MELLIDVVLDSLKDTAELVPFLFVTYLALEAIEHAGGSALERAISRAGAAGPVVGAALGAVPQCGFSAMAATLFAGGVVTAGTLVAVILSTSDELVPVFLAEGAGTRLMPIVMFKVVVGLVVGVVVDVALRVAHIGGVHPHIHDLCADAHCACDEVDAYAQGHAGGQSPATGVHEHAHDRGESGRWRRIARSAATHTVQVTLFIFIVSLALGFVIEGVGADALAGMLGAHPVRATFLAGLVGLIPNCGASVAIAQLYLSGSLAAGPMVAGLLVSGGVGLLVLFRTNRNLAQNVGITALVYAVGVACGLAIGSSGIVF